MYTNNMCSIFITYRLMDFAEVKLNSLQIICVRYLLQIIGSGACRGQVEFVTNGYKYYVFEIYYKKLIMGLAKVKLKRLQIISIFYIYYLIFTIILFDIYYK